MSPIPPHRSPLPTLASSTSSSSVNRPLALVLVLDPEPPAPAHQPGLATTTDASTSFADIPVFQRFGLFAAAALDVSRCWDAVAFKRARPQRPVDARDFFRRARQVRAVELTGQTGDVVLLHPLMLHTASKNHLRVPRVITNPPVALKAPFCFARADPDAYSLVELKTLRALGVESFAFAPTTEPRTLVPPPNHPGSATRAKSSSVPLSDSSSGMSIGLQVNAWRSLNGAAGHDFGVLPTPSPELDYAPEAAIAHGRSQMYRVQPQLPTWEVLSDDIPSRNVPVSGSKRAFEYTVDDFFTDMKKRRVTPAYDPRTYANKHPFIHNTDGLYRHGCSPEQLGLSTISQCHNERGTPA